MTQMLCRFAYSGKRDRKIFLSGVIRYRLVDLLFQLSDVK